jgi:hypothetical protein
MRPAVIRLIAGAALLGGCASHELVRADDMSAAQHRREAAKDQVAEGKASADSGGPKATSSDHTGYDPAADRRRKAEEAGEHARQHLAAAQFLEQFEDEECAGVDRAGRAACPLLGPVVRLEDVPGGVRATFVDHARARAVIAEMRCHYAFARAQHFESNIDCPLYVAGIEIRFGLDPRSVEIVARDEKVVRAIRQRSREQAVYRRGP